MGQAFSGGSNPAVRPPRLPDRIDNKRSKLDLEFLGWPSQPPTGVYGTHFPGIV